MLKFLTQKYEISKEIISKMQKNLEHDDYIDFQDYIEIDGEHISLHTVSEGDLHNVTEDLLELVPEEDKSKINFTIIAFDGQCHTVDNLIGNIVKTVCEDGELKHYVAESFNFKER